MTGRSRLLASVLFALLLGPAFAISAFAGPVDMAPINAMDRAAFVVKFGGIFEKSPWVAEKAWEKRPFASLDDMHAAMVAVAKTAPATKQLALLQAHPDLAGKEAQAGTMTASSVAEQASAGTQHAFCGRAGRVDGPQCLLQGEVRISLHHRGADAHQGRHLL